MGVVRLAVLCVGRHEVEEKLCLVGGPCIPLALVLSIKRADEKYVDMFNVPSVASFDLCPNTKLKKAN